MDDQQITPHFLWSEFWQPARHGLDALPYPEIWIVDRLRPLCDVLEALRFNLGGKPITVISGYRTVLYNRAVHGVPSSQHIQGRAADIVVMDWSAEAVHAMAFNLWKVGKLKIGGLGKYESFTHLDIRPNVGALAQWNGSRSLAQTTGEA